MFTTVTEVERITGYQVTEEDVTRAQTIIESYTGRIEVEVTDARDLMLLGRATAYQAAYMKNAGDTVFEQMNTYQTSQFGQMITFQANNVTSPWVAPLAVLACRKLSWNRIRSVRTGSIFRSMPVVEGWPYE